MRVSKKKAFKPETPTTETTAVAVAEPETAPAAQEPKAIPKKQSKKQITSQASAGKQEYELEAPKETRAALMQEAKDRAIPYFRILSRDALTEILRTDITTERRTELIEAAKTKWKAGWGSGIKRTEPTAPTVIQQIAEEQEVKAEKETAKQKKARKARQQHIAGAGELA